MSTSELIEQAIDKALAHAKENGIESGTICATRDNKTAFRYISTEGDKAIIDTVDGKQECPLDKVFDVNLVRKLALQIQAESFAPAGANPGVIVIKL